MTTEVEFDDVFIVPMPFSSLYKINRDVWDILDEFSGICLSNIENVNDISEALTLTYMVNSNLMLPLPTLFGIDRGIEKEILLFMDSVYFKEVQSLFDTKRKKEIDDSDIYTSEMVDSSTGQCLCIMDSNKKLAAVYRFCVNNHIPDQYVNSVFLNNVLDYIYNSESTIDTIWFSIRVEIFSLVLFKLLADTGFHSPYITNEDPWKNSIPLSVAFIRPSGFVEKPTDKQLTYIYAETMYIVNSFENVNQDQPEPCSITFRFGEEYIRWLNQQPRSGQLCDLSKVAYTTHEIAGALNAINPVLEGNNVVWELEGDKKTLVAGKEGSVEFITNVRYNYHTHPLACYRKYDVKYGPPSGADVYVFLNGIQYGIVCHLVVTIEGIYVLSATRESALRYKETLHYINTNVGIPKWIMDTYEQPLDKTRDEPDIYVQKMNELRGKTGQMLRDKGFTSNPIHFQFVSWDTLKYHSGEKRFTVYFPSISKQCFPNVSNMVSYEKYFKDLEPSWI